MERERGLRVIAMAIALAQDLSIIQVVGSKSPGALQIKSSRYQNEQSLQQFCPHRGCAICWVGITSGLAGLIFVSWKQNIIQGENHLVWIK